MLYIVVTFIFDWVLYYIVLIIIIFCCTIFVILYNLFTDPISTQKDFFLIAYSNWNILFTSVLWNFFFTLFHRSSIMLSCNSSSCCLLRPLSSSNISLVLWTKTVTKYLFNNYLQGFNSVKRLYSIMAVDNNLKFS